MKLLWTKSKDINLGSQKNKQNQSKLYLFLKLFSLPKHKGTQKARMSFSISEVNGVKIYNLSAGKTLPQFLEEARKKNASLKYN